ncbi:hypothetical protein LCGC14_1946350 [marine sediment metagenome]|uniref:Uncharacterized protein n=1 Tax=marine sediment metagenome TaxID=412755 RepID=A0A0F9G768_9ZZZZ
MFTVKPSAKNTFVTLEEDPEGCVNIMVHNAEGRKFRIAALADEKLYVFWLHPDDARKVTLELSDLGHPVVKPGKSAYAYENNPAPAPANVHYYPDDISDSSQ